MKRMMVRSSASLSNPTDDWAAIHIKVLNRMEDLSDVLELYIGLIEKWQIKTGFDFDH